MAENKQTKNQNKQTKTPQKPEPITLDRRRTQQHNRGKTLLPVPSRISHQWTASPVTRSYGKDPQEEDVTSWTSCNRSSKPADVTGLLLQTDAPGRGVLGVHLPFPNPTSLGERFPQHGYQEQIICDSTRRTSCSLCVATLPRIPQTPQLWPYVLEPRAGSTRTGNKGSHVSPAPTVSCQAS